MFIDCPGCPDMYLIDIYVHILARAKTHHSRNNYKFPGKYVRHAIQYTFLSFFGFNPWDNIHRSPLPSE